MIYTSYFANWRNFPKTMTPMCIANISPQKKIYSLDILSPPMNLVIQYKNKIISKKKFSIEYIKYLDSLDLDINELIKLLDNKILLCYEKKGDFCHRHIFSFWLKKKSNVEIKEL